MRTTDEIYVENFNNWLKEQAIRKEKHEKNIEFNKKLIEVTEKQIEINVEMTSSAIIDFNVWAKENNFEEIV